jgi:hypothetical protein
MGSLSFWQVLSIDRYFKDLCYTGVPWFTHFIQDITIYVSPGLVNLAYYKLSIQVILSQISSNNRAQLVVDRRA